MKYLKILIILVLLCTDICYSATKDVCGSYFDNKQYDKASSCYYSLLSKDKNNPSIKYNYAVSLFMQKKYNAAKVQFTELSQKYPGTKVGNAAKNNLEYTNKKLKEISTSRSNDSGNYIKEIRYVKWTSMPIKVWVESGIYSASAKKAFMQWQSKTQNVVSFNFVDKPQEAQITVYFKPSIDKAPSGDALGVTRVYTDNKNIARKAQMDIKSITQTGVKQTPNQIYAVVLHEVGHALGMDGHSKNQYDVMYPSDDNYRNSLSNRDINTVKYMYK